MKIIKDNSYDIVRLLVNQIGIAIFAMMLYSAAGAVEDEVVGSGVILAISIFSILFYVFLLYTVAWDYGAKDRIRVDSNRMERSSYKGALMAAVANIPSILIAAASVATLGIFMATQIDGFYSAFAAINLIMRLFMSMYLGVIQAVCSAFEDSHNLYFFTQSIGYLIAPIIPILATHFGYKMGFAEKKLFGSAKASK